MSAASSPASCEVSVWIFQVRITETLRTTRLASAFAASETLRGARPVTMTRTSGVCPLADFFVCVFATAFTETWFWRFANGGR